MLRKLLTGTVAAAMIAAPVAAQAAPSNLRTGSPVGESEEVVGSAIWIIGGIVLAGIILLLVLDDDDEPVSP